MAKGIQTESMLPGEIGAAMGIWTKQFAFFCAQRAIYPCWENNTDDIEAYLRKKVQQGDALVAKRDGAIVGFISCDIFSFHGADSAICHFCGNAAVLEDRYAVYRSLYTELCRRCVARGVLTHYISICTNDDQASDALFDLGFGSYGADAFARFASVLTCTSKYEVGLALATDTQAVSDLYNESIENLIAAPTCLIMDSYTPELIGRLIAANQVYVARDRGAIVGFLHFRIADRNNIYRMYTKGCGLVGDEIGVYIKEEYRGRGIGSHFLQVVSDYNVQNQIPCAHVPWETANPHANRFWRKFLTPTVLALKRTIHPDAAIASANSVQEGGLDGGR